MISINKEDTIFIKVRVHKGRYQVLKRICKENHITIQKFINDEITKYVIDNIFKVYK